MVRKKLRKFSEGGAEGRRARKLADIESDYQKWLKSGRYGNADVARAKYEQRKADLADDYAKWTKGDRSQTRIDEQAAERRLSEARRTKGESMRRAAALDVTAKPDVGAISMDDTSFSPRVTAPSPSRPRSRPRPRPSPQASAPAPSPRPASGVTLSGDALKARQDAEAGREALRRIMSRPIAAPTLASAKPAAPVPAPAYNAFGDRPSAAQQSRIDEARARQRRLWEQAGETVASGKKKGGTVKRYAKGGSVDGCAVRGKTKRRRK